MSQCKERGLTGFLGRAHPLYMIGGSSAGFFPDLVFDSSAFGIHFVTRACAVHALAAANFTDVHGELNPLILRVLLADWLAIEKTSGWEHFQSSTRGVRLQSRLDGFGDLWFGAPHSELPSPILVFFAGGLDFAILLQQLTVEFDFDVPPDLLDVSLFPRAEPRQHIPYEIMREHIALRLAPLFHGLDRLVEMGFSDIYLHALAPPSMDDEGVYDCLSVRSTALVRYKLARLMNRMLLEYCVNREVRFLDVWDELTVDGCLDPRFVFDHVHVNRHASIVTVEAIVADLEDRYIARKKEPTLPQPSDEATDVSCSAALGY